MVYDNINEFALKWHRVEDTLPENEPRDQKYPGDIPCVTRAEGSFHGAEPNVYIMRNARRELSYPEKKWVWDHCLTGYKIVAWAHVPANEDDISLSAPAAHAHWLDNGVYYNAAHYKCSRCGYETEPAPSKFCPECGAKMDEQ